MSDRASIGSVPIRGPAYTGARPGWQSDTVELASSDDPRRHVQVVAASPVLDGLEAPGLRQTPDAQATERWQPITTDQPRREHPMDLVDAITPQQSRRQLATALYEQLGQTLASEAFQGNPEVEMPTSPPHLQHPGAHLLTRPLATHSSRVSGAKS